MAQTKRKRGRPKGANQYTEKMFLDVLPGNTQSPITTADVFKRVNKTTGKTVRWGTAKNYLERLRKQRLVEKSTAGKISLWRKK